MKFLFASDSFKGTLSSRRTAELLTRAAQEIFPDCECGYLEVADGGEGTTEAVLSAAGGRRMEAMVCGPLWERRKACYAALDGRRAVMEMAAASGLPLVPAELRDPRNTTSYGTGELIRGALDKGFRDLSIAIGGSATNDGGIGCMRALGVRFLDEDGNEVVHYTYDSWGKILSITGSLKDTVGQLNPFRYRGYFYDTETGMYYLKSRYYDPELRRFISADSAISVTASMETFHNRNLYAYCDGNPLSRKDESGDFWAGLAVSIGIGAIGAVASIASQMIVDKKKITEVNYVEALVSGVTLSMGLMGAPSAAQIVASVA